MRLVVDTNVLISALLMNTSLPAHLLALWREGFFDLLTSDEQLDELRRVTRYPRIHERLSAALAGRLINEVRNLAILMTDPPVVAVSPDPHDDYLLGIAKAGAADFLLTGDKSDVLALKLFDGTKIVTVRTFLTMHRRLP